MLCHLNHQNTPSKALGHSATKLFPHLTGFHPEGSVQGRLVKRGDMPSRGQADPAQLTFQLRERVRPAKSKRRSVPPRPETRAVRHNEKAASFGCHNTVAFVQNGIRLVAGFQPMQHDQFIDTIGLDRPHRLSAENRDILRAHGPMHDALLTRHQRSHPSRCLKIRTQQGRRKAKADNRLTRGIRPQRLHLRPHRALRRAPESGPIIKVVQVDDVEMHLPNRFQSPKLYMTIPRESPIAMPFDIITVPCRSDNYAFLVHRGGQTALVDAPEAGPIRSALDQRGWSLDEIWITHHHDDHIAAVAELRGVYGAKVLGGAADAYRLPPLDTALSDGDTFSFAGSDVEVMDVSGHTVGHIAFYLADANAAFTADSLMALGCGRVFEGTMDQMWESLSKLAALPDDTIIHSGHEYTAANARFAATIEPENPDLIARTAAISEARAKGEPTVPSSLALEKATNPFLRAGLSEVKSLLNMTGESDAAVFAEIRRRKDSF